MLAGRGKEWKYPIIMKNAETVAAILQYHGVLSFSVYKSISVRLVHIGREGVRSVAVHRDIVIGKDLEKANLGVPPQ